MKIYYLNLYILGLISLLFTSCGVEQINPPVDIDSIRYEVLYKNVSLSFNIEYPVNDNIVSDSIWFYIKKELFMENKGNDNHKQSFVNLLKNDDTYRNKVFQSYIDTTLTKRKRFCINVIKQAETNKYINYSFSKGFDFDFIFEKNTNTFRKNDGKRMELNDIITSPHDKDFIKLLRFYIIEDIDSLRLNLSNMGTYLIDNKDVELLLNDGNIMMSLKKSSVFLTEKNLAICYYFPKNLFVDGTNHKDLKGQPQMFLDLKILYDTVKPFMTKEALELIE